MRCHTKQTEAGSQQSSSITIPELIESWLDLVETDRVHHNRRLSQPRPVVTSNLSGSSRGVVLSDDPGALATTLSARRSNGVVVHTCRCAGASGSSIETCRSASPQSIPALTFRAVAVAWGSLGASAVSRTYVCALCVGCLPRPSGVVLVVKLMRFRALARAQGPRWTSRYLTQRVALIADQCARSGPVAAAGRWCRGRWS